ncbi:hypothetical protein GCM10010503_55440 [Streptomyces lucensis JCM 4490]|uniref:Uncharacterized protein n=1 Tax=Streptomyces lucensis JCM 4490 TaxID=1306176 RepID=A0A918JB85_9ACTN|nr:hypothetical protein GCM10010503_55440 [Streptomyces lucensis JCM 4490]
MGRTYRPKHERFKKTNEPILAARWGRERRGAGAAAGRDHARIMCPHAAAHLAVSREILRRGAPRGRAARPSVAYGGQPSGSSVTFPMGRDGPEKSGQGTPSCPKRTLCGR